MTNQTPPVAVEYRRCTKCKLAVFNDFYYPLLEAAQEISSLKSSYDKTSAERDKLRGALDDARLWLGETDRHLCRSETLNELLDKIDHALATTQPEDGK